MVTLEAMRIHGGYGYTAEFPVERYYRDATTLLAGEAGQETPCAAPSRATPSPTLSERGPS